MSPTHPNARITAGPRPATRRLTLVSLVAISTVLLATACTDMPSRVTSAGSPRRGLSHEDSIRVGAILATRAPTFSVSSACNPAVEDCPAVVSADPSSVQGFSQPKAIVFRFYGPARTVSVRGNGAINCSGDYGLLIGYDKNGKKLGESALVLIDPSDCSPASNPDDITYGAKGDLETTEVMAYAVLTPMSPLEFLVFGKCCGHATQTYSIEVGTGTGISITRAQGPNPGKSFTYAPAERKITLEAKVTPDDPAADVTWEILDAPGDQVSSIPPGVPPKGLSTSFMLPKHDRGRWPTDHPGAFDKKPLKYKITAVLTKNGQTYRSEPMIVGQDLVDTIREEYYEFGVNANRHMPARDEFQPFPPVEIGVNNGDYSLALTEPNFMAKLGELELEWNFYGDVPGVPAPLWQLNTIYRNPVHNLNGHIHSESPPSPISLHMWGCAADLQTFPRNGSPDQYKYWDELAALARELGLGVEPQQQSFVGHVHVQVICP